MIVTATDLANDSKAVVDRVIERGEAVQVQRHGRSVVEIRRKVGVSGTELLDRLTAIKFSEAESREMKKAMDASTEVFGHAGSN